MARRQVGEIIPFFSLPSHRGEVRTADYRQRRNLVLVFQPHDCPGCRSLLGALAVCYPEYRELEAQVIAVRRSEPPEDLDGDLPFPVAWDETGEVFDAFVSSNDEGQAPPTVYVTDRFGEVAFVAEGDQGPEMASEILARLEFIEAACPECNTVAEGWGEVAQGKGQSEA